ncbi:MAG: DUF418 domain-containing protein [Chromatiales bacterium]|nr:DUF418 domain-containing protein [Chromatiales bacterium]
MIHPAGTSPLTATPSGERIATLDVTRGCAVLGILLMNIWAFAGPQAIYDFPLVAQDWGGRPLETWWVMRVLFEGSQRGLFSILFGAGMLLMVARLEAATPAVRPAAIYYRRLLWLLAFGLFDAFVLLWPADILITYALMGALLYPLRRLDARWLLLLALLAFGLQLANRTGDAREVAALATFKTELAAAGGVVGEPDKETAAKLARWARFENRARPDITTPEVQESIRAIGSGTLAEFYRERATSSVVLQVFVGPRVWWLDALGGMLIGMALFRMGVLTLRVAPAVPRVMMVAGYGIGLPLASWETYALVASGFDPVRKMELMIHYDLRRLAVTFGHLGLILTICQAGLLEAARRRLAAVGRMALSNYLAQSLICGLIFYTIGLGLFGRFTGYWLYLVVLGVWTLQLLYSPWWLARFGQGPAERLWRRLTYGK